MPLFTPQTSTRRTTQRRKDRFSPFHPVIINATNRSTASYPSANFNSLGSRVNMSSGSTGTRMRIHTGQWTMEQFVANTNGQPTTTTTTTSSGGIAHNTSPSPSRFDDDTRSQVNTSRAGIPVSDSHRSSASATLDSHWRNTPLSIPLSDEDSDDLSTESTLSDSENDIEPMLDHHERGNVPGHATDESPASTSSTNHTFDNQLQSYAYSVNGTSEFPHVFPFPSGSGVHRLRSTSPRGSVVYTRVNGSTSCTFKDNSIRVTGQGNVVRIGSHVHRF